MSAPLAYLIVRHDVIRQTLDGAGAACWALQHANILDVLDTLPEAKASARRIALRQDGALSILAVTVAGTMDAGAPAAQAQAPAVAPTCGVCHGAGYLTTKRGKRRRRPWPRCLACDGAGAQTPAGREVL